METARRTAILLILAILATTIAQPDDTPPQTEASPPSEISQTRTASCLVKITADPSVVPLDMQTIHYLLESSAVAGNAARTVLGIASLQESRPFEITIEQLTGPDGGYYGPVGPAATPPRRSSTPSSAPQQLGNPPEVGTTESAPSSRQPTTSSSSRSRSATRAPSNQQTDPAYGNTAFPGGFYEDSYGKGSPTSTGGLYGVGSATRGYSSYSRTAVRPPTTRTTSRASTARPTTTRTTSRSSAATQPISATQTIFFRLQVDIPDESVKPAAKALMRALTNNLREALLDALGRYTAELEDEIKYAERDRDEAQGLLLKIIEAQPQISNPIVESDPDDAAVKDQLNETVDLSALSPEMPFTEAIEEIKNSVDPPLQIVVLWRDIYDNAGIEPTTEINMNGLSRVPLHKALSLLLKSVAGSFSDGLGCSIDDGVITIATVASIPRDMLTMVYQVPGLVYAGSTATELADVILQTIEPDSWFENSDLGQGTIAPYLGSKLVVCQTAEVHKKIKDFLRNVENDAPLGIPLDIPPETFLIEKQQLQREKRMLEMDVARMKARRAAIEQAVGETHAQITTRLADDSVTTELQRILEINANLLTATKQRYESGTVSSAEIQQVEEKLARARIELARRREELSKAAGGNELAKFNSELTTLAIDLAEKTAELQVINTQLGQTEGQLAMATTLNTQLSELRYAKEAFDAVQQRVNRLKTRLANLTPPTVTVIGAD